MNTKRFNVNGIGSYTLEQVFSLFSGDAGTKANELEIGYAAPVKMPGGKTIVVARIDDAP